VLVRCGVWVTVVVGFHHTLRRVDAGSLRGQAEGHVLAPPALRTVGTDGGDRAADDADPANPAYTTNPTSSEEATSRWTSTG
jgi:hypothetical protein